MSWKTIHAFTKKHKTVFQAGIKAAKESDQPLCARLLATGLDEDPTKPDVELEAARLVLLGGYYDGKSRIDACLESARERGGKAFALEVVIASLHFERKTPGEWDDSAIWVERLAKPKDAEDPEPWIRVRQMKGDTKELVKIAKEASVGKIARGLLAFVAPDAGLWTEKDTAQGLIEQEPSWARVCSFMLAEIRNTSLAEKVDPTNYNVTDAASIAKALKGDAAVPTLRMLLRWGEDGAAEALVAIGSELSMRVLAERAAWRRVLPIFAKAVKADPTLAVRALSGQKKLLTPIVRAHLDLVAEKKNATASPDDLPRILRTPPWRMPKEKKTKEPTPKAEKLAFEPLAYEEKLDWGDRDPNDLFERNRHGKKDKEVLANIRSEVKKDGRSFLLMIQWLDSDKNARAILDEVGPDEWYGQEDDVEAILARFGLERLDCMLAFAKTKPDVSKAFLAVDSPRVAGHMAHLFSNNKKMKETARGWLKKYPRAAAIGIFPLIGQSSGKVRAALEEALRILDPKVVKKVAEEYGAEKLLAGAEASKDAKYKALREPKLPAFADPKALPRPVLKNGKTIADDATADLLRVLAISKLDDPHPGVAEIKDAFEPSSLARFSFCLFVQWLGVDGPAKDGWAFRALGFFGDAEMARTLGPMAKDWAPGGLPTRAQAAVDVLAAMNHDAAILAVHNLAHVRSKALARHAGKTMEAIAKARGLTSEELADRLVPDLGLSEDGTMSFDYGSRRFTLGFDADLAPVLRTDRGEVLDDLPKPSKSDDEELAKSAQEDWKDVKKKARSVAREQARRLEIAMSARRRFSLEHFETFFSRHPFMQHLARRVLWAVYDEKKIVPFRVAEDGTYASAKDEAIDLAAHARIGVVHPLDLPAREIAAWGEIFGSYAIVQPFPQLSRETFSKGLDALVGKSVPALKILGLRRAGWTEGPTEQGGTVVSFAREGATLSIDPGIYLGDPKSSPEQTLASVDFATKEIDPVLFSEIVRDLDRLVRS